MDAAAEALLAVSQALFRRHEYPRWFLRCFRGGVAGSFPGRPAPPAHSAKRGDNADWGAVDINCRPATREQVDVAVFERANGYLTLDAWDEMGQERIWEYFQNEGVASFADAMPRYRFLADRLTGALASGASVLNIGAGSGQFELILQQRGFDVSALDPNEAAIQRLRGEGVDGRVGLAERLPFDRASFDAVVASEVLEHLDQSQCELALAEIRRVLRNDGLFVGTVPFNEQLEGSRTVCPECGHRFHRWGHRQAFDRDGLARQLDPRFRVMYLTTRSFVAWRGGARRFLKSLVKWSLGRVGEPIADPHIYFECRARG